MKPHSVDVTGISIIRESVVAELVSFVGKLCVMSCDLIQLRSGFFVCWFGFFFFFFCLCLDFFFTCWLFHFHKHSSAYIAI